ncbi:RxLR-like protein [Plasmopara halstedii]|uniref:Lipase n=1 Tax=Plasmopara halstedii TaxID=4781 RepID=A0A0P1A8Y8_PLAHL|nr:RxLR-like protein [Plasmopara halstedii]CEG37152.1 RxLR-like protein [Plasmopara halstedii]|eukprot:XP_024573521.1 RxLR-like protein [Plasmopara halstedii]
MTIRGKFLVLGVVLAITFVSAQEEIHEAITYPDYGLSVMEIIRARGFSVEEHKVTTSDNYILTMYRLPRTYEESQRNSTIATDKSPVYLIHGLLDSSFTFVCNFRNQSLAYILADAGYDVWLGNNRGTTWSSQHLTYPTESDEFWNFSWQEMALYDMPAMINYVLNVTGQSMLSYVGHSEGTMQAFAGFSVNQHLAKKVSYFGALGPVAYVGHIISPIFKLMATSHLDFFYTMLGIRSYGAFDWILHGVMTKYKSLFAGSACDSFLNTFLGPSNNVNISRLPVYLSRTPVRTSVKNMAHFAQGIRENTFRYFDYGCKCIKALGLDRCPTFLCKNKEVYGKFEPPAFDLGAIRYPRMGFYRGVDDWLATSMDISQLRAGLKNATILTDHTVNYNHLDFTWGYNANAVLYQNLLTQIAKYANVGYEAKE